MSTSTPQVVFVIVDSTPSIKVAQPGQPPTTAAAWQIEVPSGQTEQQAVEAFVTTQNFPLGSRVYMCDAAHISQFSISASLSQLSTPGAPTIINVAAADTEATVTWNPPTNDGGASIAAYIVTPLVAGVPQSPTVVSNPNATSALIRGLTNGTAYTFVVAAENGVGLGAESVASNAVTPSPGASVPGQVTNVQASSGPSTATVSWTAPSDGGSPITDYNVTPYIGSTAQAPTNVTGSPPATTVTIAGLQNGALYTFTVTAINSVGAGQASTLSTAVTPG